MSADSRRWRLVSYDIRDPRRYRRAYKIIRGYGQRLQYSLFRCFLDDESTERLRYRLIQCLADEDDLAIIELCPRCAARAVARNELEHDWALEPAKFRLIGEDQACQAGDGGNRKP